MKRLKYPEFAEEVRKAARKRRPAPASALNGNDNLKRHIEQAHAAPRCQKKGNLKRTGKPCAAPAVRGGRYCYKHGGMQDVPAHPHNIKLLEEGKIDAHLQHNRDRQQYFLHPASIRNVINDVFKRAQLPHNAYTRKLELANAYIQDDGGRAYRRIIKTMQLRD